MKKNVVLSYKKDGRLNFASLTLTNDHTEILKINSENRNIVIEYIDDILTLLPGNTEILEENQSIAGKLVKLKTISKANYDKTRNSFKFYIPLGIIKNWNLENNKAVDMFLYDNKIILKPYQEEKMIDKNAEIVNIYSPEYIRYTLPVLTVKVEKGGIGKTFIACSTAAGLAAAGYKVLMLTTDPQNNVLDMLLTTSEKDDQKIYYTYDEKELILNNKTKGLKYWLKNGIGLIVNLRENLDFIPLESSLDNNKKFEESIGKLFYKLKDEYDCVVIDSVPTKRVDQVVLNYTNRLIIPCAGDKFTVRGVVRVIKELGADKVSAIIFNKYLDSIVEKSYYEEISTELKNSSIYLPTPIKELTAIKQLVHKSKTIWESEDKRLADVQATMQVLLQKLITEANIIQKNQETEV